MNISESITARIERACWLNTKRGTRKIRSLDGAELKPRDGKKRGIPIHRDHGRNFVSVAADLQMDGAR
jgi:hypothetical protein